MIINNECTSVSRKQMHNSLKLFLFKSFKMGNCLSSDSTIASVQLNDVNDKPQINIAEEDDEYSKSIASPKYGITSPKARFARRTSAHQGVMSSIAMKFPQIRRSFQECKHVFEKHAEDESKQYITKDKLKPVLVELGARRESLTTESLENIIHREDKIDFKQFLTAAAVCCFLKADPEKENAYFLTIRKGFEAAQLAFTRIDKDGSGRIDFGELRAAFLAMREDDMIMERLKELDFNGDKHIEFPEFLYGLCAWVGMDDDDTDDNYNELVLDNIPMSPIADAQSMENPQEHITDDAEGS